MHRTGIFNLLSIIMIALVCLSLQLYSQNELSVFQYERSLIGLGEVWRFISGHFIHLNMNHYYLNMAGFLLSVLLFYEEFSPKLIIGSLIFSAFFISLCLWIFSPDVDWYVGLSGALHGLIMLGAILSFPHAKFLSLLVILAVFAKIMLEQVLGGNTEVVGYIEGEVVVDSHLYGAVSGILLGHLYHLIENWDEIRNPFYNLTR